MSFCLSAARLVPYRQRPRYAAERREPRRLPACLHVCLSVCVSDVVQELKITELCYAEAKLAQKAETVI